MKKLLLLLVFAGISAVCFAQADSCRIIITTPGYTSIYRYSDREFAKQMACDFKVADASVTEEPKGDGCSLVKLRIGQREYSFAVSPDAPVVRLQYDRNRRLFKGMGFNYIEQTEAKYEAPSFNGVSLLKLPELWRPQIEKLIDDRSLLDPDRPDVFLLEVDIDEDGIVHRIVELGGALKQYSQVFIDKIYDIRKSYDPENSQWSSPIFKVHYTTPRKVDKVHPNIISHQNCSCYDLAH